MATKYPILKYDNQGNLIYWEDSTGYWQKSDYDNKGNRIYYENSNGWWRKWKYDDQSNMISYEEYSGYWTKGFRNKTTYRREGIIIEKL